MKRMYKGFSKTAAMTKTEVQFACLGCDNCIGTCRHISDLITIPELVLHPEALPK